MADEVTEVTTESWGERLGSSLKGVIIGLGMFLISFVLLFWNEGRAVKRAKALEEGKGKVVSIKVDKLDEANEGKLIHGSFKADTKDILQDNEFAISENAIALIRKVQIYQWTESQKTTKKKKVGGSVEKKTTYSYKLQWVDQPVDSSTFHSQQGHENLGTMKYSNQKFMASEVTFGAFKLTEAQIDQIGGEKNLPPPAKEKLMQKLGIVVTTDSTYVYVPFAAKPIPQTMQNQTTPNNGGFFGNVPNAQANAQPNAQANAQPNAQPNAQANAQANAQPNAQATAQANVTVTSNTPMVGDLRIKFQIIKPHDISIVGVQTGENITSYVAENGEQLFLLHEGIKNAQAMFADEEDANAILTWILRLVGFLLMFFGLKSILQPLTVLLDVLPILGDIADVGISLVSGLIALPLSLITIAIAWLFYRPVMAIVILVIAGALIYLVRSKLLKNKAARQAAPAAN